MQGLKLFRESFYYNKLSSREFNWNQFLWVSKSNAMNVACTLGLYYAFYNFCLPLGILKYHEKSMAFTILCVGLWSAAKHYDGQEWILPN